MNAQSLFNEAVTAGIIRIVEEQESASGAGNIPWLCNYLRNWTE